MKKIEKKIYIENYEEGITHIFFEEKPKTVEHNCIFRFEENGILFVIGLDKDLKISEIEIDASVLPDSFTDVK